METSEQRQQRTLRDATIEGSTKPHEQEQVEDSPLVSKSEIDEERRKALAAAYKLILAQGQKKHAGSA